MDKKLPIGMLGFLVGVLAVSFLISVASAGYKFGKHLAATQTHKSERSNSASR